MSTASGEPAAAPPSSPLANEELEEEGVRADIGVFADDRVGQIEDTADENGSIHREEDDVDEDPFTDRPHGILARTFKKIITGVLRSVPSTPARGGDDSDGEAGETPEEGEERDDNGDAPPEAAEVERISAPTEEAVKVDERKNLDLLPMALRTRSRDRDPVSSKELRSVKETTPAAHQRTGMSVTHSQDSRPGSVRTENINLEDLDSIEVDRLTYKQLQHVCKHHKLVANGKKVVLRQRLKNYINKQRKVDHMSTRNTEQEIREVSPKVAVDQAFHGRYEEDGMSRVDTSGPAKILRPMTTRKRTRDVGSIEPVITGENSIQKSQDGTVREDNKDPQGDLIGSGLNYVVEISSAVKRQRKSITASEFEVFTRVLLDGVHSEDRDQAVDTLNKLYQKASPTPRKQKLSVEDAHALTKEHGEALAQHATQMDTQMLTGEGQSSLPPSSAERLKGRPKTLQPRTRHVEQMVTQQRASPKKKPTVESREEMIDAVSPVEFEFRTPTSQRQNVPSSIAPIVSEANVSPRPGPRILKSSETAEPEATPVKSTQDGYPGGHAEKARFSNSRRTPRKTAGNIVEEFLQSSSTFIPKSADRAEANGFVDGGFTFEKGTSARGPRRSRRRPPSRVSLGQWRKKTEIREPEHVQYSDLRGSYMSPVSKEVVFSASSKRIMASLEKLSTPQVGSKRSRTTNFGEGSGPYTEPKMQTRRELSNKPLQPGALFINSPVDEDEREQVAEESVHVHEAEPESRLQRIRRQAMMRIAENKATAVNAKPIYVPEPDEPDEARDKLAEALKQKSEKPAANMVDLEPTKKRRFVSSSGESPRTFNPPVGVAPPVTRARAALLAKAGTTAPDATTGTTGTEGKTVGFDPVAVSAKPDFKFAVPPEPKKTNFGTGFGFSAVDAKKAAAPAATESDEKGEKVDTVTQSKKGEEEKRTSEADKAEGEQDEESEKSEEGTPPPIVLGGVAPLPEPTFTNTPLASFSGFETSQSTGGSSALLPTGTESILGGARESAKEEADQRREAQNGVEADQDRREKTADKKEVAGVKKEAPVQIPTSGFVFTPPEAEPEKPTKPTSTGTTWSQPSTFAFSSSAGEPKSFSFAAASSSGDAKDALPQGTLNAGFTKPLSEDETKKSSGAVPPSFSIGVASAAPDDKDNTTGELPRKTEAAEKTSGSDAFGASGTAGSGGTAVAFGLKSAESTPATAPSLISSAFTTSGTDSAATSTPNAGFSASLGPSTSEAAAPAFSTATQAIAPVTTLPASAVTNPSVAALAASSVSQSTEADAKATFAAPDSFPKPSFTASTMTSAATSGFGVATGVSFPSPFSSSAEVAGASTGFTFGSVGTFGSKPEAAKENETADVVGAGVSAPAIGSGIAFGGLAAASGTSVAASLAPISTGSTSATPTFSSVLGDAQSSGTGSIAVATPEKPVFGSGVGNAFMSFTAAAPTVDAGSNNLSIGAPAGGNQSAAVRDAAPSMESAAFGAASSAAPSFSTNFGSALGSAPSFGTSNFSFQPAASESFPGGQSSSAFQAPTFGSAPSTAASSAPGGFGTSSVFNANMPPPTSVFTAGASTGISGFSSSSGAMSGNASSTAPTFGASTGTFGAGDGTAPGFTANAPAGGFSFGGSTSSQPAFSGFGQGQQAPQGGSAPMGFESGQNNSFSFGGSSAGDGSGEGGFSIGANAARGRKIFRANRRRRG